MLLRDLLQSIRSLIRVWVERALDDADYAKLTLDEHRTILAAIEARDAEAAADAMDRHMDSAARRLLATLDE